VETYNKARKGKHVSYSFPVRDDLKGDLLTFFFQICLRTSKKSGGTGIHCGASLVVCVDDVKLLGENPNTI
jgi:hypothetical protein